MAISYLFQKEFNSQTRDLITGFDYLNEDSVLSRANMNLESALIFGPPIILFSFATLYLEGMRRDSLYLYGRPESLTDMLGSEMESVEMVKPFFRPDNAPSVNALIHANRPDVVDLFLEKTRPAGGDGFARTTGLANLITQLWLPEFHQKMEGQEYMKVEKCVQELAITHFDFFSVPQDLIKDDDLEFGIIPIKYLPSLAQCFPKQIKKFIKNVVAQCHVNIVRMQDKSDLFSKYGEHMRHLITKNYLPKEALDGWLRYHGIPFEYELADGQKGDLLSWCIEFERFELVKVVLMNGHTINEIPNAREFAQKNSEKIEALSQYLLNRPVLLKALELSQ